MLKVFLVTSLLLSVSLSNDVFANDTDEHYDTYIIQKGETLSHVADKYNIHHKKIMEANNLKSQNVWIGMKLKVPKQGRVSEKSDINKLHKTENITPKGEKNLVTENEELPSIQHNEKSKEDNLNKDHYHTYIIQKGETLSHVSDKFKVKIAKIMEANNLKSQNVWIGMKLKVPLLNTDLHKKASLSEKDTSEKLDPIKPPVSNDIVASDEIASQKIVKSDKFLYPSSNKNYINSENGVEFTGKDDLSVHASKNGVVIYIGDGVENLRKLIIIKHDKKYTSLYGRLVDIKVQQGDKVNSGTIIGYYSKSQPLFFAIRENNVFINPSKYLE